MERQHKLRRFSRTIVTVDDLPQIFIDPAAGSGSSPDEVPGTEDRNIHKEEYPSVFGHRISEILDMAPIETKELVSIDRQLDSSLEVVQKKLRRSTASRSETGDRMAQEEVKNKRFIEERNRAHEQLFEGILQYHERFDTGISEEDLWTLHDFMKGEADREQQHSMESPLHEHVEYNALNFLRRKASEEAWHQLEAYMEQFEIDFPVPSSLVDHSDPGRMQTVRAERKTLARGDFIVTPPPLLAELILGNIPMWVYSYPAKGTYLWELTVLQGVAAALAAKRFMRYLMFWEEHSEEILAHIQKDFVKRIKALRKEGEAADLAGAFSVSMKLHGISREEIPDSIWKYITLNLKDTPRGAATELRVPSERFV